MRKKCAAYFTVEAVLILPFVIWVIGLVIYLMLFQYNRCLLEQDMGMMLIRLGSFTISSDELVTEGAALCSGINREKYLACNVEPVSVKEQISGIVVSGKVQVNCPLGDLGTVGDVWQAERTYQCTKQSPVFIIRTCSKIKEALKSEERKNGVY